MKEIFYMSQRIEELGHIEKENLHMPRRIEELGHIKKENSHMSQRIEKLGQIIKEKSRFNFLHCVFPDFMLGSLAGLPPDGLCGTRIRGSVRKCNKYFAGASSDRDGSVWCGKWACIFCGLPRGVSGQWEALYLYGTGEAGLAVKRIDTVKYRKTTAP